MCQKLLRLIRLAHSGGSAPSRIIIFHILQVYSTLPTSMLPFCNVPYWCHSDSLSGSSRSNAVAALISPRLVTIAGFGQALIGLGTGCSPSSQTLLSRSQSRSFTLSSEPIMHFLTRPPCRGPLVEFRRRCSWCPVPAGLSKFYN